MPSIRALGLSFAHVTGVPLIEDASFHVGPGWTGLVGPNGAGKTTLLDLLAGALVPDSGRLLVEPRDAAIVVCPQRVETADAGVFAFAASDAQEAHVLRGILHLDGAQLSRWAVLSPGERKRWQIGAAIDSRPAVLLLDEPTNHLDDASRGILIAALETFDGAGLVVSHDRALLDAVCSTTLRLASGRLETWSGGYTAARPRWEAAQAARLEAREVHQREVRTLERRLAAARDRQASAERSRSRSSRAKGRGDSDARSVMRSTLADWAEAGAGRGVERVRAQLERAGAQGGDVDGATELGRSVFVGYAPAPKAHLARLETPSLEVGGRTLLRDVRVEVRRDARIWIRGANGAGKTTLLCAIAAAASVPEERRLVLPQELAAPEGEQILQQIRALASDERGRVLQVFAALGAAPDRVLVSARPSPGEARKLALALGLGRHVWLALLDEPTNHLDLPAIERLERALAAFPGALVVVTHDEAFARAVTRETWTVEGGIVG